MDICKIQCSLAAQDQSQINPRRLFPAAQPNAPAACHVSEPDLLSKIKTSVEAMAFQRGQINAWNRMIENA